MKDDRTLWISVPGRPIPKPRMTRSDKWKQRPVVMAYRSYANDIREAYLKERIKIGKFSEKRPVSLGFVFRVSRGRLDLKNLIAGVEDALVGYALSDDKALVVPSYFRSEIQYVDCRQCARAKGKDGRILKNPRCVTRDCVLQFTEIGFMEEAKNV